MYDYLKKHHGNRPSLNMAARQELAFMRELYSNTLSSMKKDQDLSEEGSSSEDDEEYVEELPQQK